MQEEVLELVFSCLSSAELHSCLRVSKQWHACLSSRSVPWRSAFASLFDARREDARDTQLAMLKAHR